MKLVKKTNRKLTFVFYTEKHFYHAESFLLEKGVSRFVTNSKPFLGFAIYVLQHCFEKNSGSFDQNGKKYFRDF